MADSILRLKVESQEYDNKLKQAAQGLTRYVDQCRKVGGTLEVVEKETLDYVRAIGQMDTTSRTATGKLAEMKKAFVELSAQYKQMTDAEKQSPFGKTLSASLDELKGRIGESKVQLDDINKSINGGGGLTGALDSLSEKFGMSVKSLAGWGTAIAAAKGALDVAKDAFFASEETVDEWGRVMDSSKSLYEGFLTALNTGDISGYLSRIDSIVQAARAAYNELDRLGTMKTIQAPQMSAQQTENERMRMMIQTGRYIAPVDGRRASMQNGQLLTPDQIKRIEQQLQGGMQKVVTFVGNEVAQTGRAIDAVYKRQAAELGMNIKEFRSGTSSMAEFDKRMQGYQKYLDWDKNARTEFAKQGGQGRVNFDKNNPFIDFKKWGVFRVDGDRYNDLVKLIQQRDQQAGQAYSMQSQAYRTMNRAEGVTLRQIMGGGDGGGGRSDGGGSDDGVGSAKANFWKNIAFNPSSDASMKYDPNQYFQSIWEIIGEAGRKQIAETIDKQWDYGKDISEKPEVKEEEKLSEQLSTLSGKIGGLAGGLSSITSGFKAFGIELPKEVDSLIGVISGVSQIISGVGTIIELFSTTSQSANTVALTANTTMMGGLIAALQVNAATNLLPFANGGIVPHAASGYMVPGNYYSGDVTPIMANAGEVILSQGQQNRIVSALSGAGGGGRLVAKLRGRDILISLERELSETGKGQLATWR